MDWQQAGALTIVAFTAALFVRGAILRRNRGATTCGGNCSCKSGTGHVAPPGTGAVLPHPPGRS